MALNSITLTSPPVAAPSSVQTPDLKVDSIRGRVLRIIREAMPLTTLFTLKLKINVNLFVKDQMLIYKIAQFLTAFPKEGAVDSKEVEKEFEHHALLTEIKTLFSKDPTPYLAYFYEACADVLNKKPSSNQLLEAFEGRIFTLKNALIAQHEPNVIQKSQKENDLSIQKEPQIKKEGAGFIRYCLDLHCNALAEKTTDTPFQVSLTNVAKQLIPFIQKVTYTLMKENNEPCPTNPLIFRNPTGYNHHGLIAAIVMEACLNALGFETRLLCSGLEPRVTLAGVHGIVQVTDLDQSKYLVDPTYIQFHQDICLENSQLPTDPVLVLKETEVDTYIEQNIMARWKANLKQVEANNTSVIRQLWGQDQLLSFEVKKYSPPVPPEKIPSNLEEWVRKAFQRVWKPSTDSVCALNSGFHLIFNGEGGPSQTYKSIQHMDLSSMTHYLTYAEIEKRLGSINAVNSKEALPLIAQLPTGQREKYLSLLDVDPRLYKQVNPGVNAYFRSLKKTVNMSGRDLCALYACSGGDCTSILLATDASDLIFVDVTEVSFSAFQSALLLLKTRTPAANEEIKQRLEESSFFMARNLYLSQASDFLKGRHAMEELPLKLLFDLRLVGVDMDQIELFSTKEGVIHVSFFWKYHGSLNARKRSLTFITANITSPGTYPSDLTRKLQEGIDIFYMKGACSIPNSYPQFLPVIAQSIRPLGWMMTTDRTILMETVDPMNSLIPYGQKFSTVKVEEIQLLEELIRQPLLPFYFSSILKSYPEKNQRFWRSPNPDFSYWTLLNLRQKNL